MMQICRIQVHAGTPRILCHTTTSILCVFVKQQAPEDRLYWRLYTRSWHFTAFILSTSAKVLHILSPTHVPHTYSVTQPLAYHVYLWINRHPKIAQIDVCTHCLDISLHLSSQLASKSFNDTDMPESSPHKYSTHILSNNHYHSMCIGEPIGTRESLQLTFIHTISTFHGF